MVINPMLIEQLYKEVEKEIWEKAQLQKNSVQFKKMDEKNRELEAIVEGQYTKMQLLEGKVNQVSCTCQKEIQQGKVCEHSLAMLLALKENDNKVHKMDLGKKEKYTEIKELIHTFYTAEVDLEDKPKTKKIELDEKVTIIPKLYYDRRMNELKLEFKLGVQEQWYKIKDLTQFYDAMFQHTIMKYGNKLEFQHEKSAFEEKNYPLIEFILKQAEMIKYVNHDLTNSYHYYGKTLNPGYILLNNSTLDEFFEVVNGETIEIEEEGEEGSITFIDANPDVKFDVEKIEDGDYKLINATTPYHTYQFWRGKNYTYILIQENCYRCTKEYTNTTGKMIEVFKNNYTDEIKFNQEQISNFFSIVFPKVAQSIVLDALEEEEIEKYMPQKLGVKVFLELDHRNYVIAKVKFCYGVDEFNPIKEAPDIARNAIEEAESLNLFRKTGFLLDKKNAAFILTNEDKIYQFLSEDIEEYMKRFEVMATQEFQERQIKQPKMNSLGIKVENNLLTVNLEGFNFDKNELKEILRKYQLKKKYHRLKDGTFFCLENNEDINFIENLITGTEIDFLDVTQNEIHLPMYRGLYLEKILENMKETSVKKDETYMNMIHSLEQKEMKETLQLPNSLEGTLRTYQKLGYQWLKTIDDYHFGGILADDMGLGKTLQLITIMKVYQENETNNRKPILVVCPSSLSLNWLNEIKKFAPELKAMVISGSSEQRGQQIHHIVNFDVVITSYDLLKRDIEIYKELDYEFRYIIADEAQYIKNSNTQNAKAIKQIRSQTRFALTGTPIENSLSELWSIFDFLMPGYLFSYRKFKEGYEVPIIKDSDTKAMQKLKMMIEPFILRRTKKEVLTELPDKTVTVLDNEMEEEQRKIYMSYLTHAREELKGEIETNGIENSQMRILSLLTRLRQICCHPSLFIDNYKGESSKLNQCIEIVKEATVAGHKILLFSGYTSMFDIIEKELKKEKISYFRLTGQTKVSQRIKLVDQFNENPEIKVFLISLKAGGTGLNLTGADMVIHYDPWWNISAENQATDRAYRIGQKNNVQVYKLITKNSIEEKIYELQEKKAKLVDHILDTKTSFLNTLSKTEIMRLFES